MKTKIINNQLNPVWNEISTFKISSKSEILKITIMDRDMVGSDDFEGEVVIPIADLEDQLKHDRFFELKQRNSDNLMQGRIHLTLQWIWNRVLLYEVLTQQWQESIDSKTSEMENLNQQLHMLRKPFGLMMYSKEAL